MEPVTVEVCVESPEGAASAVEGGAHRVELCANLACGGTTPSAGAIAATRDLALVPMVVLIRPRAGDFLYSARELDVMRRDIEALRWGGAAGFALGVLAADGRIDGARMASLLQLCHPLPVTFHRAFDQTPDPLAALDELAALGVRRVLTSGQAATAAEGAGLLARLVERAAGHLGGRIAVMPGGGIRAAGIRALVEATGAREVHFSAGRARRSAMTRRNAACSLAAPAPAADDEVAVTDAALVRACLEALRQP
jgi:copper homeostasis protein